MLEFKEHEAFVADISRQIPAKALKLLRSRRPGPKISERKCWTKAVKWVVCSARKKLLPGTIFYGTLSEEKSREWLLDAVLYVENRGVLVAVESEFEYNVEEVNYDFSKLLSIKAPLKILIVDMKGKRPDRLINKLNEYASGFEQHLAGEIYYLIDFHHPATHDVYRYEVGSTCSDGRVPKFSFGHLSHLSGPDRVQACRRPKRLSANAWEA